MLMAMFASIGYQGRVKPPKLLEVGSLLLDIMNKQEASRAYNEAAIALVNKMLTSNETHYLGRAASIPAQGYTDYMASCLMQVWYHLPPGITQSCIQKEYGSKCGAH